MNLRLACALFLFGSLGHSPAHSVTTDNAITGNFVLKTSAATMEHQVPDCELTHFPLPEPEPEGQMFQLQMLSAQSAMSGSRIMVAGFVPEDGSAKGTFAYRDDQDQQWMPIADDLDEQQAITMTIDDEPFNQWVAAADRTRNNYLVNLAFDTTTPLAILSNTGIQPMGSVEAQYQGQCRVTIHWLPDDLYLK